MMVEVGSEIYDAVMRLHKVMVEVGRSDISDMMRL